MITSVILSVALATGLQGRYVAHMPTVDVAASEHTSTDNVFVVEFEQVDGDTVAWMTSLADGLVQAPLPQVAIDGDVTQLHLPLDLGGEIYSIDSGEDGQLHIATPQGLTAVLEPIEPLTNPTAWAGDLLIASGDVEPIIFHVGTSGLARVDLPAISLRDFPVTLKRHDDGTLEFSLPTRQPTIVLAKPVGKRAEGMVTRGDVMVPIALRRDLESLPIRPQEPAGEVPWTFEQVRMPLRIETEVAGTLVLPEPGMSLGKPPLVVLITGRGQNRDGTQDGHRPLLVLADHLARIGVASIRFDAPGSGGSDPWPAINGPLTIKLWSLQVSGLVEQLLEDDRFSEVIVAGMGDGALTAAVAAARLGDDIQGVILLSCPAFPLAVIEGDHARRFMVDRGIDAEAAADVMRARLDFVHRASRGMHEGALRESAAEWLSLMAATTGGQRPSDAAIDAAVRRILLPGRIQLLVMEPRRYLPRIQAPLLGIWGLSDDILDAPLHADTAQESIESLGGSAEMHVVDRANSKLRPVPEPGRSPSSVRRTFLPDVLTIIEAWTAPPKMPAVSDPS